jgi:hypothetical protein
VGPEPLRRSRHRDRDHPLVPLARDRRVRVAFKPAATDVALILLAVGQTMGQAAASELASSVAKWARGNLSRRRRGQVRILYGPKMEILARVKIREED